MIVMSPSELEAMSGRRFMFVLADWDCSGVRRGEGGWASSMSSSEGWWTGESDGFFFCGEGETGWDEGSSKRRLVISSGDVDEPMDEESSMMGERFKGSARE